MDTNQNRISKLEIVFILFSMTITLLFILTYAKRFIFFKNNYNEVIDNNTFLYQKVLADNNVESINDSFIFQGSNVKNYVKLNNLTWQIVKINSNGSIILVLKDYINILPWNDKVSAFSSSIIFKYLNNQFLNNISSMYLIKNNYCVDMVSNIKNIKCTIQDTESMVTLLDIASYLNSFKDGKSYLGIGKIWLNNYSSKGAWFGEDGIVKESNPMNLFFVKPVIKLNNIIKYNKGDGSEYNPYIIGEEIFALGSKVKLGNDIWNVYDTSEGIKLSLDNVLSEKYRYSLNGEDYNPNKEKTLAYYLNNNYFNSLSYKDYLKETIWVKDNITMTKEESVKSSVGILRMYDNKVNTALDNYYMMTTSDKYIMVFGNPIIYGNKEIYRNIVPCIELKDNIANKLKYTEGVWVVS